jgi:hypothetical protein
MVLGLKIKYTNVTVTKDQTNNSYLFNERFCLENQKYKSRSSEMKFLFN